MPPSNGMELVNKILSLILTKAVFKDGFFEKDTLLDVTGCENLNVRLDPILGDFYTFSGFSGFQEKTIRPFGSIIFSRNPVTFEKSTTRRDLSVENMRNHFRAYISIKDITKISLDTDIFPLSDGWLRRRLPPQWNSYSGLLQRYVWSSSYHKADIRIDYAVTTNSDNKITSLEIKCLNE